LRTVTRTCAPIFSSFVRIVDTCACVNLVAFSPSRRSPAYQHVCHTAALIGAHRLGTHAVRKQAGLLLDAVLHIPATAVQVFVKRLRRPCFAAQSRDDKPEILFAIDMLGLGHHTPL